MKKTHLTKANTFRLFQVFYFAFISLLCVEKSTAQILDTSLITDKTCLDAMLPVTVGGSRDEKVNCVVSDSETEIIIVGGNTVSPDFGPAYSSYGFLYAINQRGDWVWGNNFVNADQNVETITGCKLSADKNELVVMGRTQQHDLIVMILDKASGKFKNSYSLKNKDFYEDESRMRNPPSVQSYQALLLEKEPLFGGKTQEYIYAAFVADSRIQLVKMEREMPDKTNKYPELVYHQEFAEFTQQQTQNDFFRAEKPNLMFTDATESDLDDKESFYLAGRYRGVGSVMKFQRRTAQLRWNSQLEDLTSVEAVAVPETSSKSYFVACGENNFDDRRVAQSLQKKQSEAWLFRQDTNGKVAWMLKVSGGAPEGTQGGGGLPFDSCKGILIDSQSATISALIQTKSPELRHYAKNNNFDTILLQMSESGNLIRGFTVSFNQDDLNLFSHSQNLVQQNNEMFMSGMLDGFRTLKTKRNPSRNGSNLDSVLMRLDFPLDAKGSAKQGKLRSDCLFTGRVDRGTLSKVSEYFSSQAALDRYSLNTNDRESVPRADLLSNIYNIEYSKFLFLMPLKSFIQTPRMCAQSSFQLNPEGVPIEYYRGSKAIQFNLNRDSPYGTIIQQMDLKDRRSQTQLVNQFGSEFKSDQVNFSISRGEALLNYFNDKFDSVGKQEMNLQHCDSSKRLFELKLEIEVLANSQPRFAQELQDIFLVAPGDTYRYTMPQVLDFEDNADWEILIEPFSGFSQYFPPSNLMKVLNRNRTLEFSALSQNYTGQEFFFKIVLKEEGVDTIQSIFPTRLIVDTKAPITRPGQSFYAKKGEVTTSLNNYDILFPHLNSFVISGLQRGETLNTINNIVPNTKELPEDQQIYEVYTTDILGRSKIKFLKTVDIEKVKADFDKIFDIYLQESDYVFDPKNITLKDFQIIDSSQRNQTISFRAIFEDPLILGLNNQVNDRLFFNRKVSYPLHELFDSSLELSEELVKQMQTSAWARIELTFDYENRIMQIVYRYADIFFVLILIIIAIQVLVLIYKQVGLLTFWVFLEYGQLISFLPLHKSRFPVYLYEAFKPLLCFHMIVDRKTVRQGIDDDQDFVDLSFQAYQISEDILLKQSALFWGLLFLLILVIDPCIRFPYKHPQWFGLDTEGSKYAFVVKLRRDFRYNVYIRFLMVSYFDLVFVASLTLFKRGVSSQILSPMVLFSLIIMLGLLLAPWIVLVYLCAKFKTLTSKVGKKSFNTLLLKVDKESRLRIFQPSLYFIRRFLTATLLAASSQDRCEVFLLYVFVIMISLLNLFYLASQEPYVTRTLNTYVLSMELIYFCLATSTFFFTDASRNVTVKVQVGLVCIGLLTLFVLANFFVSVRFACYGKSLLKEKDQRSKQRRRDDILRRKEEAEHRKEKLQRKDKARLQKILAEKMLAKTKLKELLEAKGLSQNEIEKELERKEKSERPKIKAVMGGRLIDYGIMSDSSEDDVQQGKEMVQILKKPGQLSDQDVTGQSVPDGVENYSSRLETNMYLETDMPLHGVSGGPEEKELAERYAQMTSARSTGNKRGFVRGSSESELDGKTRMTSNNQILALTDNQKSDSAFDDEYASQYSSRGGMQEQYTSRKLIDNSGRPGEVTTTTSQDKRIMFGALKTNSLRESPVTERDDVQFVTQNNLSAMNYTRHNDQNSAMGMNIGDQSNIFQSENDQNNISTKKHKF